MEALEIADAAAPGDNPQLVKNRCDQRRWLAGKYNTMYSDKVAVTDSDGGSIAARLARMSAEERLGNRDNGTSPTAARSADDRS